MKEEKGVKLCQQTCENDPSGSQSDKKETINMNSTFQMTLDADDLM